MYEKVNPEHPDKIADRIAGAIVDLGYKKEKDPKIAVEVLIGHSECNIIIETTVMGFTPDEFKEIVNRIAPTMSVHDVRVVPGPTHTNIVFDVVITYFNDSSSRRVFFYISHIFIMSYFLEVIL